MYVCFAECIPKMCSAHVQSLMDWMDSKTARQTTEQVQPWDMLSFDLVQNFIQITWKEMAPKKQNKIIF